MTHGHRVWPHFRAVFVAFHLLAITLMALPAPSGTMNRQAWADPTVQGEFIAWSGRLNDWGWSVTPDQLQQRLWDVSTSLMEVRTSVLTPFKPYHLYCGTWQSWRMFVAPHRFPARIHIDIRDHADDPWQPIYVSRSAEHDWRADMMDHDRMRSNAFRFAWLPYRRTWTQFAHWAARRIAADYPNAHAARFQLFKYETRSPEQVRSDSPEDGAFQQLIIRTLEPLR